jgi:hypothetical protein
MAKEVSQISYSDMIETIELAKKNNLLTEKVKIYLAGYIAHGTFVGNYTLNQKEELERIAGINRKDILAIEEIAWFGELVEWVKYPY